MLKQLTAGVLLTITTSSTVALFLQPSPANAANECQCTQYVANRFGIAKFPHAADWNDGYLQQNGFQQVAPQPGTIVVMERTFSGANSTYGHVGIVEKVENGRVTVRGANQTVGGNWFTEANCYNVRITDFATPISGSPISFWSRNNQAKASTWVLVANPSTQTADVSIKIAGKEYGRYSIPSGGRIAPTFPGTIAGPVHVVSNNGVNVITSQRSLGGNNSFNELAGIPLTNLATRYFFPWYDSQNGMPAWVIINNPSSSTADVSVRVGGIERGRYSIPPGGTVTPTFNGLIGGLMEVNSVNGVPITTSQRVLTANQSFNEFAGIADNALANRYYFPWYDSSNGNQAWLIINNPTTETNTIAVRISGAEYGRYDIPPGGTITPLFNGVMSGLVEVVSLNNRNFTTSQRVLTADKSFNEFAGIAANSLTNRYFFPWYDSTNGTNAWVIINNPGSQTAEISLRLRGAERARYIVPPGQTITPSFTGWMDGPMEVVSTNGVNFTTSQRVLTNLKSFNEYPGIPATLLTNQYAFPWYHND